MEDIPGNFFCQFSCEFGEGKAIENTYFAQSWLYTLWPHSMQNQKVGLPVKDIKHTEI